MTQYRCWREQLQPQLEAQHIRFHSYPAVPEDEWEYFDTFFKKSVYPVLTPLAIDPAHPFPQLLNKSLNVIVELEGDDLETDIAVVQVPRILPRVVPFSRLGGQRLCVSGPYHPAPRAKSFSRGEGKGSASISRDAQQQPVCG